MNLLIIKNRIGSEGLNTIQTFFARIIAFSIGLLFKILLARLLTVEENGVFGKWLATYNYGIIAFSLGLNLSMIYNSKSDKSKLNNFFGNAIIYSILLIICILIGLFLPSKLYNFSLCIAVFFGLLIGSLNSIQLIDKKITIFNITEISRNLLILLVCLFPIYYLETKSLEILYILYPCALVLTFIIFAAYIDFSKINFKKISIPKLDYIKYGLKGTFLNVLSQSVYIVDIFLVSFIAGDRYLGLYVVASSIARLLWFFVDAAGTIIFPKLVQTSNAANSQNIIYKLSTFSFLISICGLIVFYFIGEYLISLTFGNEYSEGFMTIIILMIASPGMIFYKLINRYLASKNEWIKSYIAIGISLIVNVVLNLYLIKEYNIIGAAIASLISYWLCGFIIAKISDFNFFKLMFSRDFIK